MGSFLTSAGAGDQLSILSRYVDEEALIKHMGGPEFLTLVEATESVEIVHNAPNAAQEPFSNGRCGLRERTVSPYRYGDLAIRVRELTTCCWLWSTLIFETTRVSRAPPQ